RAGAERKGRRPDPLSWPNVPLACDTKTGTRAAAMTGCIDSRGYVGGPPVNVTKITESSVVGGATLADQPASRFQPRSISVPISRKFVRRPCQLSPTTSQFTIGGRPPAAEGGNPFDARPVAES